MDETDTEIDDLEFEESSTTRWWPSSMGEVRVALPAVDPLAQIQRRHRPPAIRPKATFSPVSRRVAAKIRINMMKKKFVAYVSTICTVDRRR